MSLLPRQGICFSCGHDHGTLGMPKLSDFELHLMDQIATLKAELEAARRTTPDRDAIIEECAKVCDLIAKRRWYAEDKASEGCEFCAYELRLMKTAPTSDKGGA